MVLHKVDLDDVNIDDPLKNQIGAEILQAQTLMPFLIDLTIEERKKRAKIGPRRRDFVNEMEDVVNDNPGMFPVLFKKANFLKAVSQERYLEDIRTWAQTALEHISDTHLDVGSIAYNYALEAYGYLKSTVGMDEQKKKMKDYFAKAEKEGEETSTD